MTYLRTLVLVLIFSFSFTYPSAYPCSPNPYDWINSPRAYPENGADNLPRNLRLLIEYEGDFSLERFFKVDLKDLRIISKSGKVVPLKIEQIKGYSRYFRLFSVKPATLFERNSRYFIQSRMKQGRCREPYSTKCLSTKYETFSSFVTGFTVDNEAPRFSGLKAITVKSYKEDDSCGTAEGFGVGLLANLEMPNESHPRWIRFHLYDASDLTKPIFSNIKISRRFAFVVCQGSYVPNLYGNSWIYNLVFGRFYVLRAVDVAGNVDGNTSQQQYLGTCSGRERVIEYSGEFIQKEKSRRPERESVDSSMFEQIADERVFVDSGERSGVIEGSVSDVDVDPDLPLEKAPNFEGSIELETRGCLGCHSSSKSDSYFVILFVLLVFIRKKQL